MANSPAAIPKSFTVRYNGRANALKVETSISIPTNLHAEQSALSNVIKNAKKYIAIWDTGATNSVISQKVVNELNLGNYILDKPNGMGYYNTITLEVTVYERSFRCFWLLREISRRKNL